MRTLTGLGRLSRVVVRLDRVRLLIWVLGLVAFMVVSAWSLRATYPDQASIETYTKLFGDNPALIATAGPGYGFDDPNLGVILVNETQLWGCILFALMSIFLVNRHTRAEEDVERAELLRSSPIGRHAPSASALVVVGLTNVAIGALCGVGFLAFGYEIEGSLALAGSYAACGLAFVGVTAVAAQIASGSRATLGASSGVLALSFVVRALGDIGDNMLRWLSPIGWAQGVRAFAGERWWTLGGCLFGAVGLVLLSFWLATRRDLGSGMLPQRLGRAEAARWVRSPLGLAIRLQRGFLIGWMIGGFLLGVVYGSIGRDIETMIEDQPDFADFLAQLSGVSIADAFLATSLSMLSLIATGYMVAASLRLRSEETAGRAEPILAAPVARLRWAVSHLAVAAVGAGLVMSSAGLGIGISYAIVISDSSQVLRMLAGSLTLVPAVYVIGGVAVAAFGWLPRRASAVAWGVMATTGLILMFGELLRLPGWTRNLSPIGHVPAVPARPFELVPVLMLLAVAAAFSAVGLAGFRRRDIAAA